MWHVWGMRRGAYRVLVGKPEGSRQRGRPRRRWEDNINTFTAIVDLSRSNFSIARAPLFQLKSAT